MTEALRGSEVISFAPKRKEILKNLAESEARQFIEPFTTIEEGRKQISECLVAAEEAQREVVGAVFGGVAPEVRRMILEASTVRECWQILDQKSYEGSAISRLNKIRELVNENALKLVEAFQKIDSTVMGPTEENGVTILKSYSEKARREQNLDALNTALIKLSDQIFLLEGAVLSIVSAFQQISDSLQRKIQPTVEDVEMGNLTPFQLDDEVRGKLRVALAALNEKGNDLSSLNDRLNVFEDSSLNAVFAYVNAVRKGDVAPGDKNK